MTPEEVESALFKIEEWPVITPSAKNALAAIVDSHFILTPPVYDHPGQLIRPRDYVRHFRGATVVVNFGIMYFSWENRNMFCAELAHLCVLVTPSPYMPVTPHLLKRMVLDHDRRYPITQPNFKKARLDEEGILALAFLRIEIQTNLSLADD